MIEHGRNILDHGQNSQTQYHKSKVDFNETALVAGFLTRAAQIQQEGSLDLLGLISPLLNRVEGLAIIDDEPRNIEVVNVAKSTLAQQFSNRTRELEPEDFCIVTDSKNGLVSLNVVLASPEGLDTGGSFDDLMSESDDNVKTYTVQFYDQEVDTRTAMTRRLHRAMNIQAVAGYIAASPVMLPLQGKITSTWYTGDRPQGLLAPFGNDADIYPERHWRRRDTASPVIRFRPALPIPLHLLNPVPLSFFP